MRGGSLAVVFVVGLACANEATFLCESDSDCANAMGGGQCEPNRACSFLDDACPSGRRYGEFAGGGLSSACVPLGGVAGSTGMDDASADGDAEVGSSASEDTFAADGGSSTGPAGADDATSTTTVSDDDGPTDAGDVTGSVTTDGGSESSGAGPLPCQQWDFEVGIGGLIDIGVVPFDVSDGALIVSYLPLAMGIQFFNSAGLDLQGVVATVELGPGDLLPGVEMGMRVVGPGELVSLRVAGTTLEATVYDGDTTDVLATTTYDPATQMLLQIRHVDPLIEYYVGTPGGDLELFAQTELQFELDDAQLSLYTNKYLPTPLPPLLRFEDAQLCWP